MKTLDIQAKEWFDKANTPKIAKAQGGESLEVQAKRFKSAEEFVASQTGKDYRSTHQVVSKNAIPISSLNESKLEEFTTIFKKQYGYPALKSKEINKLKRIMNNPDTEVTIYRASPIKELNDGDWVTIDRDYANDIKRQNGGKVYKYLAKSKDLYYPNTVEEFKELPSLNKWGAFQYNSSETKQQLTDIWNKANGNSYFSGTITTDFGTKEQKNYSMPFQYGYGDHYIDMAKEFLEKNGAIKVKEREQLWRYCEENNIILRSSKQENCLKREVMTHNENKQ